MKTEKIFSITGWVNNIIKGPSGFSVCENREIMVHPDGREISVAEWVLRCLSNPECKDSEKVLEAITKHRDGLKSGKIRL